MPELYGKERFEKGDKACPHFLPEMIETSTIWRYIFLAPLDREDESRRDQWAERIKNDPSGYFQLRAIFSPVKRPSPDRLLQEDIDMRSPHVFALAVIVAALSTIPSLAQEQGKKINRSDLPSAVEKTVATQIHGATIRGFNEEQENGKTYYEAELTVNGHSKDVLIEASGAIAEVEEQVDLVSLPPGVRGGLQAKAGKGKIRKVESISKHDKLVAYEAKVVTDGKRSEVQVGPDGKPLDHEE